MCACFAWLVFAVVAALLLAQVDMTGVPLSRLEREGEGERDGEEGRREREQGDELVLLS